MSTTLKISNGDIDIDQVTGAASVINGVDKCSQDVAEVLMIDRIQPKTSRSAAAFKRSYGNELASLQAPTFFSGVVGKPLVAQKIQEAIQSLIELQDADPNIDDAEHIDHIGRLLVEQLDVTDYIYFLEVVVRSGGTVPTVTNLSAVKLEHQYAMTSGAVDVPDNAQS